MTTYAKIVNNSVVTYPYSLIMLQQEYPNTSFPRELDREPQTLASYDIYSIKPISKPIFDNTTHKIQENNPVLVEGEWQQNWSVVPLNQEETDFLVEATAAEVRQKRNTLLAETDWTQLADVVDAVGATWAAYRQALRDVAQQPGFPFAVVWPTPPVQ